MATKVYLFTGIETFSWQLSDFQKVIDFCKAHHIDGIVVKIYEVTQGEWYQNLGGAANVVGFIEKSGLDCLPYGFYYGATQPELDSIRRYLSIFDRYCCNMEGTWDNNLAMTTTFVNSLKGHTGELWISTWANPADHKWLPNIAAMDMLVQYWMPEEYSDGLIDLRLAQFPPVKGRVVPTYAVNQETIDRMAITDFPSVWEYQGAVANPAWIDQLVAHMKPAGVPPVSQQPWFMYPIVVPFGNPAFDSALGGAHDLDIGAPANYPVTALLPGKVSDLSSPPWGRQVGIQLDVPFSGVPYMGYLHLSAIAPNLVLGQHVSMGQVLGWVGGANDPSQYAGTSNPTGQNFLNPPFQSSRIQVGVALMRGPAYGFSGWEDFPPVDWALDPTPIIEAARKAFTSGVSININQRKAFEQEWQSVVKDAMLHSGIANQAWADYQSGNGHGPALSEEFPVTDWNTGAQNIGQIVVNGIYVWSQGKAAYHPYH